MNYSKAEHGDSHIYDDSDRRDVFLSTSVRDIGLRIPGREGTVPSGTFGGILWYEPRGDLSRKHVEMLRSRGFRLALSSDVRRIRSFYASRK